MGRLVVVNFMSLDGVIQSVLAPDEDTEGGFAHGGWVLPYVDPVVADVMTASTVNADGLLLGRKTYEAFAARWPYESEEDPAVAAMNRMPKYVVSRTLTSPAWQNTVVLGPDLKSEVSDLLRKSSGDLVVFGSSRLVPTLLADHLVDELRLLIFPIVLGSGKRMFGDAISVTSLELVHSVTSTTGVLVTTYRPAVRTL